MVDYDDDPRCPTNGEDLEALLRNPIFGDIIAQYLLMIPKEPRPLKVTLLHLEEDLIDRAMLVCQGNKAAAARLLGLTRTCFLEMFNRPSFQGRKLDKWRFFKNTRRHYLIDKTL